MKFLGLTCALIVGTNSSIITSAFQDPNCLTFGANGKCTTCIPRTVNISGTCKVVSDLCLTWGKLGKCLTCYPGYKLAKGACS
jgi:hypothetical protein